MTKEINIIDALDKIQSEARFSGLGSVFQKSCKKELEYLNSRMDLTPFQATFIAILSEKGEPMSWKEIGDFVGLSRLKIMSYDKEIEILLNRRWVLLVGSYHHCGPRHSCDCFKLARGIMAAFRKNEPFEAEKIDNLSEQTFVDMLAHYVRSEGQRYEVSDSECERWLMLLVEANMHLPLCKKVMSLNSNISRIGLLLNVADYADFNGTPDEGITLEALESWFGMKFNRSRASDAFREGTHELQICGLFEFACENGLADNERYRLTDMAKETLLGEYSPRALRKRDFAKSLDRNLIKAGDIAEKKLFFTESVGRQLSKVKSLIGQEQLEAVRSRLEESGLRKGVACLFYGSPGTGKTETALQLAKQTGRDIMQVNIAEIRDKFVGESEKNIMGVFMRYRSLCKGKGVMPILLFNEADAIFGERFETTRSSVEKMDNSIQNIILQEMETFEGILIATTNLTGTLDKAFDRRFLFKVRFDKPDLAAKSAIWQQLIPELTADESHALASEFGFAGGEIENVARKFKIEYILTGSKPGLEQVRGFCREESLRDSSRSHIGF